MALTPRSVFRYYETDGVPSSGKHEPIKAEIIQLLEQLFGVSRGGWIVARTVAELNGITPENETDGGVVLTGSGAGYYDRDGGAWVFGRGFPDTFARVELSGTGTSQSGTVSTGVTPSTIEVFFAFVGVDNTGPLTLSISGESPREVVNLAGNSLAAGEWTGTVMFALRDGKYQLLIDAGSAASAAQSASEAQAWAQLSSEIAIPAGSITDLKRADTADAAGAIGNGIADDTAVFNTIEAAGGARLGRGKVYLTTLDELIGDYEGPGNIILASPARAYSPQRIQGRKLVAPVGLGWSPEILPYYANGRWRGHISALSLFPAVDGATYYVDPSTGNDGNAGTTVSPLASITAALGKADVGEVLVAPMPPSMAHETRGMWGNPSVITSAAHVIVRPWNIRAGRPMVARAANHQASSWTPNGSNPNVYTFPLSTEPTAVIDLAGGLDGEPVYYAKVGLITEASTRPGSWGYNSSNEVFVNPINDGAPGASIKILRLGTCGYWPSNKALYVDGLDFIGGTESFEVRNQSCDVVLTNCRAIGANNNGFSINTSGLAILENCKTGYNRLDGFNYHKPASFPVGRVIEINCGTLGASGIGLGLNNQISTIHDGVKILRIGSEFDGSGDQIISDVNAGSMAWNVGLRLGSSRDESVRNTGYELSDGAEGWFYDCDLGHSARQLLTNASAAYLHNTSPSSFSAINAGTIEAYVQG